MTVIVALAGIGAAVTTPAALAGVAIIPPRPTPAWLQAETVPVSIGSGLNPNRPAMALLPNGTIIAVAATPTGIADLARRSAARGRWSRTAAGVAANPATYVRPLVRVSGGGEVMAAWAAGGVLSTAMRVADGTWTAPFVVAPADATLLDVAVNQTGGAVVVWKQGNTLRARTRTASDALWSGEATIATSPTLGSAVAAVGVAGDVDVLWTDGPTRRYSRATLATNTWGPLVDLPGHDPAVGASFLHVRPDAAGGAAALWSRDCELRAATRNPGSGIWVAHTPAITPSACGAGGYQQVAFDMNLAGRALFAGSVDEGPGPDSFRVGRRSGAPEQLTNLAGPVAFHTGATDGRHTIGAPITTVSPNGAGYFALTEGALDQVTGNTAVGVTNVSPSGGVSNGFIAGSRALNNRVVELLRLTEPSPAPTSADPLNRLNSAVVVWYSSARQNQTPNTLRVAVRPGAGLKITKLTRLMSGGRTAARVTINEPARVTVTFSTASGRRLGRVVRSILGGTTVVGLPGSGIRPLGSYRVRVDAINGGARASRTAR